MQTIKRQVKARVEWTIESLRWMHGYTDLKLDIKYFDGTTFAGWADVAELTVEFNKTLLLENPTEFIRTIVPHETAHIIDALLHGPLDRPHGPTFGRMMKSLDLPSVCYHLFDTDRVPQKDPDVFVYKCWCQPTHRHEVTGRAHKIRQNAPVLCPVCGSQYQFSHIRQLRTKK